jgi:hypothetical protein
MVDAKFDKLTFLEGGCSYYSEFIHINLYMHQVLLI